MILRHTLLSTLAGPLLAVAAPEGLRHLQLLADADAWSVTVARLAAAEGPHTTLADHPAAFEPLARQLGEYFAGLRREFDLPLAPRGTAFQQRVWDALRRIAYGHLRSYSRLAVDLGSPGAARAVGQAASQNPILILVPCHRLLGNDGRLVGFSAGTELKAGLLRLEGHRVSQGGRIRPPRLF